MLTSENAWKYFCRKYLRKFCAIIAILIAVVAGNRLAVIFKESARGQNTSVELSLTNRRVIKLSPLWEDEAETLQLDLDNQLANPLTADPSVEILDATTSCYNRVAVLSTASSMPSRKLEFSQNLEGIRQVYSKRPTYSLSADIGIRTSDGRRHTITVETPLKRRVIYDFPSIHFGRACQVGKPAPIRVIHLEKMSAEGTLSVDNSNGHTLAALADIGDRKYELLITPRTDLPAGEYHDRIELYQTWPSGAKLDVGTVYVSFDLLGTERKNSP